MEKSQTQGVWTLQELHDTACAAIPDEPGVYFVLVPNGMDIQFRAVMVNHYAPFYTKDVLLDKFTKCRNKTVLYIGKANGKKGLRQRIWQYIKYGWNEAVNHKGGRAIWQIEHAENLVLTYEVCPEADEREHHLLEEFRRKYDTLPLANWRT